VPRDYSKDLLLKKTGDLKEIAFEQAARVYDGKEKPNL
jgi:hypothetical protein